MDDKDDKLNKSHKFFNAVHTNGLKTQRDAWCYNYSSYKVDIKNTIKIPDTIKTVGEAYNYIISNVNEKYFILLDNADYLDVEINVLTKIDPDYTDSDIVRMFHKKSRSKYAFQIADNLSDMILFHKKVRENNEKYNSEFM